MPHELPEPRSHAPPPPPQQTALIKRWERVNEMRDVGKGGETIQYNTFVYRM